jgi:hypothetical protein
LREEEVVETHVRWSPSFDGSLLDEPPSSLVFLNNLDEFVLDERDLAGLIRLEREESSRRGQSDSTRKESWDSRLVHVDLWFRRRRRRSNSAGRRRGSSSTRSVRCRCGGSTGDGCLGGGRGSTNGRSSRCSGSTGEGAGGGERLGLGDGSDDRFGFL